MEFKEYQEQAKKTAIFPKHPGEDHNIFYATLGLAGEAGELANKVKKILRGDYTLDEYREKIIGELGGVLWYLAAVATEAGVSLEKVALENLLELAARQKLGKIQGDGDTRGMDNLKLPHTMNLPPGSGNYCDSAFRR